MKQRVMIIGWMISALLVAVGGWAQATSALQRAINTASEGASIEISPGVYKANLFIKGKNLTIRSTQPHNRAIVETTVIDGGSTGSCITFDGTEGTTCVLEGLTLRNGLAARGGAINGNRYQYSTGAKATIRNCIIIDNTAQGNGGALYDCDGLIEYNYIEDNQAANGGGLAGCDGTIRNNYITGNVAENPQGIGRGGGLFDCDGEIRNNLIGANRATADFNQFVYGQGGGLESCRGMVAFNLVTTNTATGNSSVGGGISQCANVHNNLVANNTAYSGAGIYKSLDITNNLIYGNTAEYRGGALLDCQSTDLLHNTIWGNSAGDAGGGLHNCLSSRMINTIVWGNTAATSGTAQISPLSSSMDISYSCIQDWRDGGIGNLVGDPMFVDPAAGNFQLQPGSSCIDAGTYLPALLKDFADNTRGFDYVPTPRGDGSDFDIGAYEYIVIYNAVENWALFR